ncbi:MAG: CrcB family protein [Micrococcales bacterium]|nr:CrcB family protein [Micrococcales bacterium]
MASRAALPEPALLGTVAVGGVLGSLGRWGVGLALPHGAGDFPWATFVVNVTGAFAMGLLVQLGVLYVGATFLVGTIAVAAGMLGGRRVWPGP